MMIVLVGKKRSNHKWLVLVDTYIYIYIEVYYELINQLWIDHGGHIVKWLKRSSNK